MAWIVVYVRSLSIGGNVGFSKISASLFMEVAAMVGVEELINN